MSPVLKVWCRSVKIPLRYLSFCWNLTKIAHFELIQATLVAKLAIVCHFELLRVKWFEKVEKLQKIADVPPQEQKFLRFLQKWDTLVVKRWEKLWMRWNWPFQVNLSLILKEKMEKPAKWTKLAIWSQSKPLFWQNLPLWVTLSHFSVKWFEKVEKLKKIASAYQSRFCWDI